MTTLRQQTMRARGAAKDMWLLMGRTVHDAEDTILGAPTKTNHRDQPGPSATVPGERSNQ